MSGWTALPDGVKWRSEPLVNLRLRRCDIESRYGPAHLCDVDSGGVGTVDVWCLRYDCGLEAAIWFFTYYLGEGATGRNGHANVEIHANDNERSHLLWHLGLPGEAAYQEPGALRDDPTAWLVTRMDDNGCRFEVGRYTSQCEAAGTLAELERRKHKQTYFLEHRHRGSNRELARSPGPVESPDSARLSRTGTQGAHGQIPCGSSAKEDHHQGRGRAHETGHGDAEVHRSRRFTGK